MTDGFQVYTNLRNQCLFNDVDMHSNILKQFFVADVHLFFKKIISVYKNVLVWWYVTQGTQITFWWGINMVVRNDMTGHGWTICETVFSSEMCSW